jgi:hypothetical protein
MVKLKVFFVMGVVISILVMCAFAPGICIERFVLPDGCGTSCETSSAGCTSVCMAESGSACMCR